MKKKKKNERSDEEIIDRFACLIQNIYYRNNLRCINLNRKLKQSFFFFFRLFNVIVIINQNNSIKIMNWQLCAWVRASVCVLMVIIKTVLKGIKKIEYTWFPSIHVGFSPKQPDPRVSVLRTRCDSA